MPDLVEHLALTRCPHCHVDRPSLFTMVNFPTSGTAGGERRFWRVYACERCGGVVTAYSDREGGTVVRVFPEPVGVDEELPSPAREYLIQARDSLAAPAGAVMLAASAADAMLKAKGYTEGNLYPRINKAAEDHLITEDMAQWAHEVRLEANDPRHANISSPLPSREDAARSIDFVQALGQLLFVLPERVKRGREEASSEEQSVG